MMRRKLCPLVATVTLAFGAGVMISGCYTTVPYSQVQEADCGPIPTDGREQINTWLAVNLKDYDSAKVVLSDPRKDYSNVAHGRNIISYGWTIDAEINAKNSFGGYTGFQKYQFFFYNANLIIIRKWDQSLGRFVIIGTD